MKGTSNHIKSTKSDGFNLNELSAKVLRTPVCLGETWCDVTGTVVKSSLRLWKGLNGRFFWACLHSGWAHRLCWRPSIQHQLGAKGSHLLDVAGSIDQVTKSEHRATDLRSDAIWDLTEISPDLRWRADQEGLRRMWSDRQVGDSLI